MVSPRHKLPIKKVHLQDSQYNLYEKNRTVLERIPKTFAWMIAFGAMVIFVLYFDFFGWRTPQTEGTDSVVNIAPGSNSSTSSTQPSNPELETTDTLIKITQNQSFCYLQFATASQSGASLTSTQPTGWWSPTDDCTLDITEIAITRNTELQTTGTLVDLDTVEPRTVVVIFGEYNGDNLTEYVKKLTLPVFDDRIYFSASRSIAQLERAQNTWYLDGRCSNIGLDTCAVFIKKNDGSISQINKEIFVNQTGAQIQFATTQPDDQNTVSIVQLDENNIEIAQKTLSSDGEVVGE